MPYGGQGHSRLRLLTFKLLVLPLPDWVASGPDLQSGVGGAGLGTAFLPTNSLGHSRCLAGTVLTHPGEGKQGLAPKGAISAKKVVVACQGRGPPCTLVPMWQLECPAAPAGERDTLWTRGSPG